MAENIASFHGPLSERVRHRAAAYCRSRQGRLLDVGCGSGLLFEALGSRSDLRCCGLDRSFDLLREIRRRCRERVVCVRGLLDHLPFRDRSFDVVTCLNTLLNLPSLEAVDMALHEMMRVSARHVIVDIRNAGNPYMRLKYWRHRRTATFPTVAYRLDDIERFLQSGGFGIEEVYPVGMNARWLAWGYVIVAVTLR
jgi:ubiquinone/menaquinone biosynthesis C-methylase UbiE